MIARHYKAKKIAVIIKAIEGFDKRLPTGVNTIKAQAPNSQEVLGRNIQKALKAFAESVLAEQPHESVLRYLILLKEFGAANFAYASRKGETFAVTINGESFELTGAATSVYVDTNTWEKAFYSALVLRDGAAIETLALVDETVFTHANIKCDQFDLALVQMFQGLFIGDVDVGDLLENALLAADPDKIDSGRRPYVSHILLPLLSVYRCIYSPDAENEFNEAMRAALEKHKAYWKKDNYEIRGWISLPLMAAAAHAYDQKGYQLNFETDYIPNWLVTRDFTL
ncbi:immunity 49 family protein [Thalassomonas sp. RHCl1]|uniref:immunity 49 family protein n=1 Tax=Thalassomonas sp. RHCl1 TaxID=2995320 RepID=UPI00248B503C|nr:immunity 49 family protein [Thalassomonas sp. RHCl1]